MPYSTRFFLGNLSVGVDDLYTVPAQFTAVIRDMRIYGNFAADAEISIGIEVPGPLTGIIWFLNPLAPGATASWEGRQVLNAGDVLNANSSEAGGLLTISGYLLSD